MNERMMDAPGHAEEQERIFALDIGTRSVIGVVGAVEEDVLRILQVETQEHTQRAVVDGQIENIEQTAKIAAQVRDRLQEKLGITLSSVHVAAAGRVLKTQKASSEMELDERSPIEERQIYALESQAIQSAYEQLLKEAGEEREQAFYCVGHSVTRYLLDGYSFSTLVGHRGKKASVELIATFLPSEVVESIYATMARIHLSVASLTLEPIAAMNAVVPRELRLLNVALVDVGAGTSDIAIANGGSVCAYTMATVAGDEITERIMREYLVDFSVAEEMKRLAGEGKQSIPYTDILGLEYTTSTADLLEKIQPSVEELATTISQKILEVNGGPPMAVFMVGGGSRTPQLCEKVAAGLGIDEKKVAIGGNNYMKRMVQTEAQYVSAEYATPFGIAISAMQNRSQEKMSISLNGSRIQLMGGGPMTVMEALIRGGYAYSQIMGRSGRSLTFQCDGEKRVFRGEPPTLCVIEVNGRPANITTPLNVGDDIRFVPAQNGRDASLTVREAVEDYVSFTVELEGLERTAGVLCELGGNPVPGDTVIRQMDRLTTRRILTVRDLLEEEGLPLEEERVWLNGELCRSLDEALSPGDRVVLSENLLRDEEKQEEIPSTQIHIGEEAKIEPTVSERKETSGKGVHICLNGQERALPPKEDGTPYQFFDVLNFVDIDPTKPQGNIRLLRNGRPASYLESIQDGDLIEVAWDSWL